MENLKTLIEEKKKKQNAKKPRYALRKLSVGLVSCMIGYFVFFGGNVVYAAEQEPSIVNEEGLEPENSNQATVEEVVDEAESEEVAEIEPATATKEETKEELPVVVESVAVLETEEELRDSIKKEEVFSESIEKTSEETQNIDYKYVVEYRDALTGEIIFLEEFTSKEAVVEVRAKDTVTTSANKPYVLADENEQRRTVMLDGAMPTVVIYNVKSMETNLPRPENEGEEFKPAEAEFRAATPNGEVEYTHTDGKVYKIISGTLDGNTISENENKIIKKVTYRHDTRTGATEWKIDLSPYYGRNPIFGILVNSDDKILSLDMTYNSDGRLYRDPEDWTEKFTDQWAAQHPLPYKNKLGIHQSWNALYGGVSDNMTWTLVTEGKTGTFYVRAATAIVDGTLEGIMESDGKTMYPGRYDESPLLGLHIPEIQDEYKEKSAPATDIVQKYDEGPYRQYITGKATPGSEVELLDKDGKPLPLPKKVITKDDGNFEIDLPDTHVEDYTVVVTEKGKEASDLTSVKVDKTNPSTPVFGKIVEGDKKVTVNIPDDVKEGDQIRISFPGGKKIIANITPGIIAAKKIVVDVPEGVNLKENDQIYGQFTDKAGNIGDVETTLVQPMDKLEDTDQDGKPDTEDADDDGDGVNDKDEEAAKTNPKEKDSDHNGKDDGEEDSDGDGINNDKESDDDGTTITDKDNDGVADLVDPADKPKEDTDNDGIPDETDPDDDGDGVNDKDEEAAKTNPKEKDSDHNGKNDGEEDSDGDGISNDEESHDNGTTITDKDNDGVADLVDPADKPKEDTDKDGIPDETDPDDDGDGVNDKDEEAAKTNPKEKDSDHNGKDDGEEDSDGDGINNDKESDDDGTTITDKDKDGVADLVDPADKPKEDTDNDGIPDETDPDDDGDGVNDKDEEAAKTNPKEKDSDHNGKDDGEEDSDGDGINNDKESDDDGTTITDKDNDGVADLVDPADKPKEDTGNDGNSKNDSDKNSYLEGRQEKSEKNSALNKGIQKEDKDSGKNITVDGAKENAGNINSTGESLDKTKTSNKQDNSKMKKAPKTGDVSNVGGLAGLMMLSGSSLLALVGRKRRRLEDDEE